MCSNIWKTLLLSLFVYGSVQATQANRPIDIARHVIGTPSIAEEALHPLTGGLTASVYVVDGDPPAILRLTDPKCTLSGFLHEIYATQLAAELGIGPKLLRFDSDYRALLLEYVPNALPTAAPDQLKALGEALHRLHNVVSKKPFAQMHTLYHHICERQLPAPQALACAMDVLEQIERDWASFPSGVTHNDLHLGNILWSESGPRVIDWTSASWGDPYFDLAKLSISMEPEAFAMMWFAYLGGAPSQNDRDRLQAMRQVTFLFIALNRLAKYEPSEHTLAAKQRISDEMDQTFEAEQCVILPRLTSSASPEELRRGAVIALRLFFQQMD